MKNGNREKIGKIGEYLLYGVVILLPWQARYIALPVYINGFFWEYASVSLYAIDLLIIILAILAFLYGDAEKIKSKIISISITALVATYVILLAIVSTFSRTSFTGVLILISALLFAYSLLILPWNKRKLLIAVLIAAFWSGTLGMMQFLTQDIPASTYLGIAAQSPYDLGVSVIEAGESRYLRAYGSLSHPNILGGLMMVAIFSALLLLRGAKLYIERGLLMGSVTLFTYYLFITFSRSALLGLLMGLAASLLLA